MSETWYREIFDAEYLRLYLPTLTAERTEREVAGVLQLLQLPPGAKILDLCCGHGRHAVALAERGYPVTGQDLSGCFLDMARASAAERGADVRWVESDMREIPFEGEFDAVLNLFTAFGYLESEAEDQKVLQAVHRALKPGGGFLMDMIHRDNLLRRLQNRSWQQLDNGSVMLMERSWDQLTSRQSERRTTIHPDGRTSEYALSLRLYTLTEFAKMFAEAGLPLQAYYGDFAGSPLTLDSHRMVLIGQKGVGR